MSVTVMAKVWSCEVLPPNQRLVLLAYADHANDAGCNVFPGEDLMAIKTGYSTGTVRRITSELIRDGYLVRVKAGHRGQRAEFRINITALDIGAHDARLSDLEGAQPDQERRANSTGKARAGDTPNHHEPSVRTISKRKPDLLWETFVAVHGEPATQSERGKFNTIVKKLRQAEVTPDEYPGLVQAYVSKHKGLQPAAATVAERVGELRHYARHGPLQAPSAEELVENQKWSKAMEALP